MESQAQPEYVLYLRKSNGRKAVPRQRTITAGHIRQRGGVIIAEFSDTDSTAYARPGAGRPERDDFDKMLALLRGRPGLRVAAWHADRLLRNQEDTAVLIRVCAANGHVVETPSGGEYDLSIASGRKRLRDDASDAEYEVDHGRERVIAAKDESAAAGLWLGGRRPFGWEIWDEPVDDDGEPILDEDGHPAKGYLLLHDTEADLLREAHKEVLAGQSIRSVVTRWRAAGILTSTGRQWTQVELRKALLRPRNAGLYEHRGNVVGKAQWPPIVDEHTHRRVVRLLKSPGRLKHSTRGEVRHLLSGIARCGVCGGGLIVTTIREKSGSRAIYRCRDRSDGRTHVTRDAKLLEEFVTEYVLAWFQKPAARRLLVHEHVSQLPALEATKHALIEEMQASNDLRRRGLLTNEEFAAERTEHQERMAALDNQIADAEQADTLGPMVRDPMATWQAATLEQKRAIIRAVMVVTVHVQPKGRPKGWRPGEPYFDFGSVKCEPKDPLRC